MKKLKRIFLVIIYFAVNNNMLFAKCVTDTTIILQNKTNNYISNTIYIDTNINAKQYKIISDFTLNNSSDNKISADTLNESVSENWSSIYIYKNSFYVYSPCDQSYNFRMKIKGKKIYEFQSEIISKDISAINKINNSCRIYTISNYLGQNEYLKIVSLQKGISIFEITGYDGTKNKKLMVQSNMITHYPIIINDCSEKVDEFEFDKIDFEKILIMLNK